MDVVIDTQAINRDHRLSSPATRLMFEQARTTGHRICMSDVVVREMVAHYAEEVSKTFANLGRYSQRLATLLDLQVRPAVEQSEVDNAPAAYERWLRSYVKAVGGTVLPLPAAASDVTILLSRDLARRRPFDEHGRGMRDALLWETLLELATKSNGPIALITGNTKDFCAAQPGELHPDLVADLKERGIAVNRVQHVLSVQDFNENHIKPAIEQVDVLRAELQEGSYDTFDLHEWLENEPPDILAGKRISASSVGLPPYYVDIRLASVLGVSKWDIQSVVRVDPSAFYVEGTAELEGMFEVAVDIHRFGEITELEEHLELVQGLPWALDTDRLEETEESVFNVRFTLILSNDGTTEGATMDVDRDGGRSKRD